MRRHLSRLLDYLAPVSYGLRCWLAAFGYEIRVADEEPDVIA